MNMSPSLRQNTGLGSGVRGSRGIRALPPCCGGRVRTAGGTVGATIALSDDRPGAAQWSHDRVGPVPRDLRVHGQHLPVTHGGGRLPRHRDAAGPRRPHRVHERRHRRLARRRAGGPPHDRGARPPRL
ncbi:hypothetical protein MICRO8M_10086 [Microbacterium sp. 8M]|nr:hypothetical protein MICRO8M_10086 [Microbacterium sp. 8M]